MLNGTWRRLVRGDEPRSFWVITLCMIAFMLLILVGFIVLPIVRNHVPHGGSLLAPVTFINA